MKAFRPAIYKDRLIELMDPDGPKEGVSILRKGAKLPKSTSRVHI